MPHVAAGDLCAAPHDVPRDRFAARLAGFHAVPYRTSVECLVLERRVLEWLVLERLAVPEPQHLTS